MPRIRGRLYSSWASSTWSFPSALTRVLGEDVEDQLRPVDHARREQRSRAAAAAPGRGRRSTRRTSARASLYACFSSSSLPLPTYVRGSGRCRCCTSSPTGSTSAVRASSWSSPSSSSGSMPCGSTATMKPRSGSKSGGGSGRWRLTDRLCPGRVRSGERRRERSRRTARDAHPRPREHSVHSRDEAEIAAYVAEVMPWAPDWQNARHALVRRFARRPATGRSGRTPRHRPAARESAGPDRR